MGRFHPGKAASLSDSILLIIRREVIKLTAGVGPASDVLILTKDANTTADGHGRALVVTCEVKQIFMSSPLDLF